MCTEEAYAHAAVRYLNTFESWGVRGAPIPLKTPDPAKGILEKSPAVRHKDGQWSREKARAYFQDVRTAGKHVPYLGIQLRDLFVLDIDTHAAILDMVARFPELEAPEVPRQLTKKGKHYVFLRTALADELEVTDSARGLQLDGATLPVDIKTRTGTGTAGILAVWPSPDKEWEASIFDRPPPPPVPDNLVRWLHAHKSVPTKKHAREEGGACGSHAGKKKAVGEKAPGDKDAKVVSKGGCRDGEDDQVWPFAPDAHFRELMRLFGFPLDRYGPLSRLYLKRKAVLAWKTSEHFHFNVPSGPCDICGHPERHKNQMDGKVRIAPRFADGMSSSAYSLKASHWRASVSAERKKCKKSFFISSAAAADHAARFEAAITRACPKDAAAEVALFGRAGVHFGCDVSVWPLTAPAPGYIAHAIKNGKGKWFLTLRSTDGHVENNGDGDAGREGGAMWYRHTNLPGLFYEFVFPGVWARIPLKSGGVFWTEKKKDSNI
jgi:hypothetical protein